MKLTSVLSVAALSLLAVGASAITVDGVVDGGYGAALATDNTTGPVTAAAPDIVSLFASSDATHLYVAITGSSPFTPSTTDWGKFCVYVDGNGTAGPGSFTDTWGRNVTVGGGFNPNVQAHSWVDGTGGGAVENWTGSAWAAAVGGSTGISVSGNSGNGGVEFAIPLTALAGSNSVRLSAWSTGGGATDPAVDAAPGRADQDWGNPSTIDLAETATFSLAAPVSDWAMYN